MRKNLVVLCGLILVAAWSAGSARVTGPFDAETIAGEMVRASGWETASGAITPGLADDGGGRSVASWNREVLFNDVAHYSFDIRFGPGEYDVFRLHRVVKERAPYIPVRARNSIFLQHGDGVGFVKFIFGSETPYLPDEQSFATYLALDGIDVWGIDQPWVLVPPEETDYTFGADWDMQFNVDCLHRGIAVAHFARFLTGSGNRKMNLLGYSSGVFTTLAYLNEESQLPPGHRMVDGFIAADVPYKIDPSTEDGQYGIMLACIYADYFQELYEGGVYNVLFEPTFPTLGSLAESAPDDPSPWIEGLTNLQAALVYGAVPFPDFWPTFFHYWAGVFEDDPSVPVGLSYTATGAALDFLQTGCTFEPMAFYRDYYRIWCDEEDLPWDNHLGEITNRIFNLGANGGTSTTGLYTLGLLGSTDVTSLVISLSPPEVLDFGHIDLWTANDSPDLVWAPLLEWIEEGHPIDEGPVAEESVLAEARPRVVDPALRVTPNPGRTSSYTFAFDMARSGGATVEIYDVAGRLVAGPLTADAAAGHVQVAWNALSSDGRRLGQGIYFARVTTPESVRTAKFVHLGR